MPAQEWSTLAEEAASRDPRKFPYGIFAGDSFVLATLRVFFWFETPHDLIDFVLEVLPRVHKVTLRHGLEAYQARVRPILERVREDGFTEHLRRELEPEEDGGFAIDWWGHYHDLRDGRDDFGCDVRDGFVARKGQDEISPLEREDEFVEYLWNYGV